uniref:PHD-type domain-containing protein n=1 Tax=Oryza meridionalis TaxID=40149 RepID=A0A0E0BYB4_9ORYZ
MEFAGGSGSVRDLPPSKRFKYVGSSLGLAPCLPAKKRLCPPMPEAAAVAVPVCLPAKKRAYAAAAVEGGDFALCLPAKKRTYAPPVDGAVAPACLPAKKRIRAPPPDSGASPCVPATKRVDILPPPPPVAAAEKDAISPSIPVPVRKRVHAPPPPEKAAVSPSIPVPAKKRIGAPPAAAATDASPRVPFKDLVNTLPPPRNAAVSPSIPAKKSARAPPSPKDIAAPVSVCLPSNKRVMPPFLPPSPPPSKESDGARVAAVKEAKPQGSNKRGATTDPSVANGVEDDYARAEASKIPEKPINHEEIEEQVSKKPRSNTCRESKHQECKQSCSAISAKQSEVEALKKACKAIDLNEAAREEDSWDGERVAREPKQEAMAAAEEEEVEEEDDGVHCAVCGSTDGDPSDPIVFCDGCDLMVHASCYGNPLASSIPDGDWFCSVCAAAAKKSKGNKPPPPPPRCCLCPARGGAMKRTTDARWAHIACALLVPEVFFRDPDGRDGVDCSRVPARRFATACYVCASSGGCALECSQPRCGLGFHVSCGLDAGLCIEYQEAKAGGGGGVVAGFCLEHTKLWEKQQLTGKYKIVSRGQK